MTQITATVFWTRLIFLSQIEIAPAEYTGGRKNESAVSKNTPSISQGSVATGLRCDTIFNDHIAFLQIYCSVRLERILKSVNIWQGYGLECCGTWTRSFFDYAPPCNCALRRRYRRFGAYGFPVYVRRGSTGTKFKAEAKHAAETDGRTTVDSQAPTAVDVVVQPMIPSLVKFNRDSRSPDEDKTDLSSQHQHQQRRQ